MPRTRYPQDKGKNQVTFGREVFLLQTYHGDWLWDVRMARDVLLARPRRRLYVPFRAIPDLVLGPEPDWGEPVLATYWRNGSDCLALISGRARALKALEDMEDFFAVQLDRVESEACLLASPEIVAESEEYEIPEC